MAFSQFDSRSTSSDIDTKSSFPDIFDDSDSLATDSLDSAMISPTSTVSTDRKDSFTPSTPFFHSATWDDASTFPHATTTMVLPERQHPHFSEMSNNPYLSGQFHHPSPWLRRSSEASSKVPVLPATYEHNYDAAGGFGAVHVVDPRGTAIGSDHDRHGTHGSHHGNGHSNSNNSNNNPFHHPIPTSTNTAFGPTTVTANVTTVSNMSNPSSASNTHMSNISSPANTMSNVGMSSVGMSTTATTTNLASVVPIVQPSLIMPPPPPMPASPMMLAEVEVESRRGTKRRHGHLRDGVRKKNARFDIPPERSLQNIDMLIANCTNEEGVKELKQQKRLLRNRQAALDSRQRKKKHTEDLEDEKKLWTERNAMLEVQLANLAKEHEGLKVDYNNLQNDNDTLVNQLEALNLDRECLVSQHTSETSNLRKKISVLTAELEHNPIVHNPATEFNDFSDLENLTMGGDWENNFVWIPDDEQPHQPPPPPPRSTALVIPARKKEPQLPMSVASEQPSNGILLLLLLYGAFVAATGTVTTQMPRMSECKAEAQTILANVLNEDDHPQSVVLPVLNSRPVEMEPVASWVRPSATSTSAGVAPTATIAKRLFDGGSSLDALTAQLITPSKEQEAEAAFNLTPAQYNAMTSVDVDFPMNDANGYDDDEDEEDARKMPGLERQPFAETLRQRREEQSAAEVYSRSLLWEKLPSEVVREFKRMVQLSRVDDGEKTETD